MIMRHFRAVLKTMTIELPENATLSFGVPKSRSTARPVSRNLLVRRRIDLEEERSLIPPSAAA